MNIFLVKTKARYVLEVENKILQKLKNYLKDNNVYFENIGFTQKNYLKLKMN